MKTYVEFYHLSTGYVEGSAPPIFSDEHKKPVQVCGSDGTIQVDGRLNMQSIINIAKDRCMKFKFIGFKILKGETANRANPVSDYIPV